MTNIIIHGVLGKIYGNRHKLKVRRMSEIIPAINANNPGFKDTILSCFKSNIDYCFVDPKEPNKRYKRPEEILQKQPPKEIHIVPSIVGAGAIALIGGGLLLAGAGALVGGAVGGFLVSLGISLALQGVAMLLFPTDDPQQQKTESKIDTSSYIFSNRANNAVQGFPVPLVYGEIRVGSNIISTNIVSEDMG
tara:strand:+ start:3408 stop:3983 length:576 start_codon:yes stop_codon:yes gene_type:complete